MNAKDNTPRTMELIKEIEIKNLKELKGFAQEFVQQYLRYSPKVFFYGEMGVGKTTFIKMLCEALGISSETASPTFALVNQYPIPNSSRLVHHADLYRLESTEEAYDIGLEDLLFDDNYLFVEWPEFLEPLAPEQLLSVRIRVNQANHRVIEIFLIKEDQ